MSNYIVRAARHTDGVRRAGVLGLIIGGAVAGASGDYGSSSTTPNPLIPADGAFTIWLPIYAGCLTYAGYQSLPSQAGRTVHRQVGLPLASTVALSGTWVWLRDPPWLQLPAIAATLGVALTAHQRASRHSNSTADRWLVAAPTGLLAGWLSLASVVAAIEVGIASGWPAPPAAGPLTLAGIAAIAAVGVGARRTTPPPATYSAAVAWGLAGIAVSARRHDGPRALTAALGAAAVALTRPVRAAGRTDSRLTMR